MFDKPCELIQLADFRPAFALADSRKGIGEAQRRFGTLMVPDGQKPRKGAWSWVQQASNAQDEVFAVKRLNPDFADDTHRDALREEFRNLQLLGRLEGFPQLYGMGYADGNPVIVMEWVEGITLEEARGSMAWTAQAVAALGVAIARILVTMEGVDGTLAHRDLSTRNIIIRTDAKSLTHHLATGEFSPCLIDFGSASFTQAPEDPSFTQMSSMWRYGTPEYAPPEMLTRDLPDIDQLRLSPAIDVYALCSILYHLLTGRTPFDLAGKADQSAYVVKTTTKPDPILAKDAHRATLAAIIMSGLAVKQGDRPQPKQLLDSLIRWQQKYPAVSAQEGQALGKHARQEAIADLSSSAADRADLRIPRWGFAIAVLVMVALTGLCIAFATGALGTHEAVSSEAPESEASETPVTSTDAYDSPATAVEPQAASADFANPFANAQVGDVVEFGTYEQDGDLSNGAEPIKWKVLSTGGNAALAVSVYALDCVPYDTTRQKITWQTSEIRQWLNGDFKNAAFNSAESDLLVLSEDAQLVAGASEDAGTYDEVFLLRKKQVNTYMTSTADLCCLPTQYCIDQGSWVDTNGFIRWWLLEPSNARYAGVVQTDGSIGSANHPDYIDTYSIRPAIWVSVLS